jgi:hypothetical protein
MKPQARTIVRVIVLAIGGLVTAFGVYCLIISCVLFVQLWQWGRARLLDIEADVSQPGEFSGQFIPKCPIAICYRLLLVLPPSLSDRSASENLLAGMEARLSVTDSHGSELPKLKERPVQVALMTHSETISLGGIPHRLPEETYMLRLTISQGAKALSGTQQRLILKYAIGFQGVAWLVGLVVAIAALAIGAILLFAGVKLGDTQICRVGLDPPT